MCKWICGSKKDYGKYIKDANIILFQKRIHVKNE